MDFTYSARQQELLGRLGSFMEQHVYPAVPVYEEQMAVAANRSRLAPIVEALKAEARAAGLWNLFMPSHIPDDQVDRSFTFEGPGLSNLDYAPLAEMMGRVHFSSRIFNCSPPDTGNMEILSRYGTREQKERWLRPLMDGTARSAFLMTEPHVASSDATNVETMIMRDGDHYVLNGRKWWSTGMGDEACAFVIVMGKSNPAGRAYDQQSQIIVPTDTPGLKVTRMLTVFGFDDAPYGHAEVHLDNVRVPVGNILLGEGRGFEIAQGRLGPGRIHHCMRIIGAAEAALELMVKRLQTRVAFGKTLASHSVWEERVAEARVEIDMCRLLCLRAADRMDREGNKAARTDISMIKLAAPRMALRVIDDAIQAHGGAGVSSDFGLAKSYAGIRALRIADGPDEVHCRTIARAEFKRHEQP
jgi:acyl-CoA dehydrogenase